MLIKRFNHTWVNHMIQAHKKYNTWNACVLHDDSKVKGDGHTGGTMNWTLKKAREAVLAGKAEVPDTPEYKYTLNDFMSYSPVIKKKTNKD